MLPGIFCRWLLRVLSCEATKYPFLFSVPFKEKQQEELTCIKGSWATYCNLLVKANKSFAKAMPTGI